MGNSKEISQDLGKIIADLHMSGPSLGAISKRLKVPRSSVQTIVRKYKHIGTMQLSYSSGRRHFLSPRMNDLSAKSANQSQNKQQRTV
jgi:transposase